MNQSLTLPKKLLPLLILKVLRKYTDESHHLSQAEIRQFLQTDYGMKADRKTVHRNISYLLEMGYPIEYSTKQRRTTGEQDEDGYMMSDFWFPHEFTESELRLLIDSVLFSTHIPHAQRTELVEKLSMLSSKYFESHVRHVSITPDSLPQNPDLFFSISILDEAIEAKRKVVFNYLEYKTDKKVHLKRCEDGKPREYVVSPYQMAAKEGKYYLICNYDKYNDISNYRVDRIANIRLLEDEPIKPFKTLQGAGKTGLDLAKYMVEHVYMYSSPNVHCKFRITKPMISDVIDMFGLGVSFTNETDTHVTVSAYVNERAMQQFAKNFGPDVIVLEPQSLADEVCREMKASLKDYQAL